MWGPVFADVFDGSMCGAGSDVFAVWVYCIAHGYDGGGVVRINPKLLATVIGSAEEKMVEAIEYLCAPDDKSASKKDGGARLLHLSGHEYGIVNWDHYQDIIRKERKRAADRERIREKRAAVKSNDSSDVANVANRRKKSPIIREDKIEEDKIETHIGGNTSGVVGGTNNPGEKKKRRTLFLPPSVEEVQTYIDEKSYHIDAGTFIDHYTSNGWMVGKNKMKVWKAACRTWEKRWKDNHPDGDGDYLQRDLDEVAREEQRRVR